MSTSILGTGVCSEMGKSAVSEGILASFDHAVMDSLQSIK